MKIVSKDSFMSIRGTDMHQGYTHASGVQTCIRGTDTCIRGTDMLQGYRHASGVQTCFRGTDMLQRYKHMHHRERLLLHRAHYPLHVPDLPV